MLKYSGMPETLVENALSLVRHGDDELPQRGGEATRLRDGLLLARFEGDTPQIAVQDQTDVAPERVIGTSLYCEPICCECLLESLGNGPIERGQSQLVLRRDVDAAVEEQLEDCGVVLARREHHRRLAARIAIARRFVAGLVVQKEPKGT